MTMYEKAHAGEELKLLDFGNYVFSQSTRPHDFRALLPKVYAQGVSSAHLHYVAHDENGDIRAMVACLPLDMRICGEPLKVGTVGTVSVHPYARGEGHMKHVMRLMHEDAAAQKMDVLVLGGRRQRYNYFGYEHAGANAQFYINRDNVRHAMKGVDASAFALQVVKDEDAALLDACYTLYEKGPVCGARPKDEYLRYMHSWNGDLVAVLKDGQFVGALHQCGTPLRLGELLLQDEGDLLPALKCWMEAHAEVSGTWLTTWGFEQARMSTLENVAEDMRIGVCQMVCILRFERTLRALMALNARCKALNDGEVVLQIEDETLKLSVKGGVPAVSRTDEAPQLTYSRLEAQRMLFLPARLLLPAPAVFQNWLPLPWVMPTPDHF